MQDKKNRTQWTTLLTLTEEIQVFISIVLHAIYLEDKLNYLLTYTKIKILGEEKKWNCYSTTIYTFIYTVITIWITTYYDMIGL